MNQSCFEKKESESANMLDPLYFVLLALYVITTIFKWNVVRIQITNCSLAVGRGLHVGRE